MTQHLRLRRLALALAALPVAAPHALAQYAPPPAAPAVAPASVGFASAYRAAGRPRIVLFWNRDFSDAVSTEYDNVTSYSTRNSAGVARTRDSAGAYSTSEGEVRSGIHRNQSLRDSGMSERGDMQVESAFTSDLVNAGANLVDRNTIVRLTGRNIQDLFANQQSNETKALLGHADILLEVIQTEGDGPLGTAFKVSAKDIRSGRILAQFLTDAIPPQRAARWVAGPSGFVKETLPPPSGSAAAHRLSDETLRALTRAFARR